MFASRALRTVRTINNSAKTPRNMPRFSVSRPMSSNQGHKSTKHKFAMFALMLSLLIMPAAIQQMPSSNDMKDMLIKKIERSLEVNVTSKPDARDPIADLAKTILRRASFSDRISVFHHYAESYPLMPLPVSSTSVFPAVDSVECPYQKAAFELAYDSLKDKPSYSKEEFVRIALAVNEHAELELVNDKWSATVSLDDLMRHRPTIGSASNQKLLIKSTIVYPLREESAIVEIGFRRGLTQDNLHLLALIRAHQTTNSRESYLEQLTARSVDGEIQTLTKFRSACLQSIKISKLDNQTDLKWGVRFANEALAVLKNPEILKGKELEESCDIYSADHYLKTLKFLRE